jgi:ribonuclease HII
VNEYLIGLPLPVAGVDEAGRGPLAGPVVAAAVVLDPLRPIRGIDDSKKLSPKRRESLFGPIQECALAWAIGWASAEEIDAINILQASLLAMRRALDQIQGRFASVAVDGNRPLPRFELPQRTVVKGDSRVPEIGAASILAKVARDRHMLELDERFPVYGFAQHMGYPTPVHLAALQAHGPCPEHRRTFGPVSRLLLL